MSTKKLQIIGGLGNKIEIDATLTQEGKVADAKAVGDALAEKLSVVEQDLTDEQKAQARTNIDAVASVNDIVADESGNVELPSISDIVIDIICEDLGIMATEDGTAVTDNDGSILLY